MQTITRAIRRIHNDSLARNSLYIMISSLSMAIFGFFFWIIVTRLYSTQSIGLATSLISVMGLVSTLSQLGFNNTLIRYLPQARNKNDIINTSFILVAAASVLIGIAYIIGLPYFSPKLLFIRQDIFTILLFILVMAITAVNSVSDNIFIAYRSTKYILIYNSFFNVTKLLLPFFLVILGPLGIFLSVAGGITTALILTFVFLISAFQYIPQLTINPKIIKDTFKYSAGTYVTGLIGGIPSMVIPILVLNILGASYAAYYYMAFTIASLMFIIPQAVTRSLFAESTQNNQSVRTQVINATKLIYALIIPVAVVAAFGGTYILLVFGTSYSSEGLTLLRYFAASTVFMGINYIGGTLFYIRNDLRNMFIYNTAGAVLTLVLSAVGLSVTHSLAGLGAAFLATHAIMCVFYLIHIYRTYIGR